MKNKTVENLSFLLALTVVLILIAEACQTQSGYFRSNYDDVNEFLHESQNLQTKPFLKAHLRNGDICILTDTWQVDSAQDLVTGNGTRYDFNRVVVYEGRIEINIDSVAIFETNKKIENPEQERVTGLSILAGLNLFVGTLCAANPKACFGSCPTFYINEDDNFHYADAEGFSNAISPSLEYYDIDALNNQVIEDNTFSITMKNEALETHCVKEIKLLAYPIENKERVYQTRSNEFYLCENFHPLKKAIGNEGDITQLLKYEDRHERFSLSDENDLSTKEEIILTFENKSNRDSLGLILSFRQTLMTTYFIYSALGYMGDEVADIFAELETNVQARSKLKNGIRKELGNIDIYVWSYINKKWELQNGFYETGPIAFNRQILPLSNSSSITRVKVVLNKGLWRIDYFALTDIVEKVKPIEIVPESILNKGDVDNPALVKIKKQDQYLVSMPGSEYKFNFNVPYSNAEYELFLYSKGYYLEWMRDHWIKDKDLLKLKQMIDNPKKYLLKEAKGYKHYETSMEDQFWNSRIDTKTFSYYEK